MTIATLTQQKVNVVVEQPVQRVIETTVEVPRVNVDKSVRQVVQLPPAVPEVVEIGKRGIQGPQGPAGPAGATLVDRTAAITMSGHVFVRTNGGDTVGPASADNPLHGDDTMGITIGASTIGGPVQVQTDGPIVFNGWSWTVGEPVFLGHDGQPTQTPDPDDAFLQVLGFADSADTLFIQVQPPIYNV